MLVRYQVGNSGSAGAFDAAIDTLNIPTSPPSTILSGATWNFQAWFRDQNPMATSNFTDGISLTFR